MKADTRLDWWREARFGLFIHWGLYAIPAGEWNGKPVQSAGEWIMNQAPAPVADYEKLAAQFNPVKFDAKQWARTARDAGMKYIVITSKHHDGFAMYGSKASKYNIVDATPFHRDPIKELAAACQKAGVKLGFYYSQTQDWHEPDGNGHLTTAPVTKFDPVSVKVKAPVPATTELGLRLVSVGTGFGPLMVNDAGFEVPPLTPGVTTVTEATPPVAMSEARMIAVN